MGYIYKISNNINNKVYIGQTVRTVNKRWEQHKRDASYKTFQTHLYLAIYKYGIDNFYIETIEECPDEKLDEREIYWIKQYNSFHNGYNETLGGGGRYLKDVDNEKIYELWDNGLSISGIAEELNTTRAVIRNRIYSYKNYSEEEAIRRGYERNKINKYKKTYQWDLNGNLINIYNSQIEAAEKIGITNKAISYAIKNKSSCMGYFWTDIPEKPIIKNIKNRKKVGQYDLQGNLINIYNSRKEASNAVGVDPSSIGKCCNGNQKTAGGFIWKSIDS